MILLDEQRRADALEGSGLRLNSYSTSASIDYLVKSLQDIAVGDILWDQQISDHLVVQERIETRDPEGSELLSLEVKEGSKSWTFLGDERRVLEISEELRRFGSIVVLKDSDALLQRRLVELRRDHARTYDQNSTDSHPDSRVLDFLADGELKTDRTDWVFSWKNPLDLKLGELVLTNFGWRPVNRVPGKTTIFPSDGATDGWYMRKRVLYNLEAHFTVDGAARVPVWGSPSTAGDRDPEKLFSQRWVPLAELTPGVHIRSSDGRWRKVATVWHPQVRRGLKKYPGHMATVKYPGIYDLPIDLTLNPNLRGELDRDPEILVREELTAVAAQELQKGTNP